MSRIITCCDCGERATVHSNRAIRCVECRVLTPNARASQWYIDNKEKKRAYDKKRRSEKRHLYREASERHRNANPAKKRADTITRRYGLKKATPEWANFGYMNLFYKLAKTEAKRIGEAVHVDHIIPIVSKLVCGLHCEYNMQLLTASDNLRKNNHYSWGEA